jgi:hypothetical protein
MFRYDNFGSYNKPKQIQSNELMNKMKIKVYQIHKNTISKFDEVNEIFKKKKINTIERTNALNFLSNATFLAKSFHHSLTMELNNKDKNYIKEYKWILNQQKNEFEKQINFYEKDLSEYYDYYLEVLNDKNNSHLFSIPLLDVEENMNEDKIYINNSNKDEECNKKTLIQKFISNYANASQYLQQIWTYLNNNPNLEIKNQEDVQKICDVIENINNKKNYDHYFDEGKRTSQNDMEIENFNNTYKDNNQIFSNNNNNNVFMINSSNYQNSNSNQNKNTEEKKSYKKDKQIRHNTSVSQPPNKFKNSL